MKNHEKIMVLDINRLLGSGSRLEFFDIWSSPTAPAKFPSPTKKGPIHIIIKFQIKRSSFIKNRRRYLISFNSFGGKTIFLTSFAFFICFGFLGNKIITISERKTAKAKIETLTLGKLKYNVKANGNAIAQINKRPLVREIKSLCSSSSFITGKAYHFLLFFQSLKSFFYLRRL